MLGTPVTAAVIGFGSEPHLLPRPVVLVVARWADDIGSPDRPGVYATRTVVDAVVRAGGEPVLAWPDSPERAEALVALADAVLLQGGNDLDLRPFGVPDVHPRETHSPPEQDAADVSVARAAAAAGLPILAICRGMQVLGVVLGGTIHQHYEETSVPHADNPHDVDVVPGTLLEQVMGRARCPAGPTTTRPATASPTAWWSARRRRTGASRRSSRRRLMTTTPKSLRCNGIRRSTPRPCRTSRPSSTGWCGRLSPGSASVRVARQSG